MSKENIEDRKATPDENLFDVPFNRRRFLGVLGSAAASLVALGVVGTFFKKAEDSRIAQYYQELEEERLQRVNGIETILDRYLNKDENPLLWQKIEDPNAKSLDYPGNDNKIVSNKYELWFPENKDIQNKPYDIGVNTEVEGGKPSLEQVTFFEDKNSSIPEVQAFLDRFLKYKPKNWVPKNEAVNTKDPRIKLLLITGCVLAGVADLPDGTDIRYRVYKNRQVHIDIVYPGKDFIPGGGGIDST